MFDKLISLLSGDDPAPEADREDAVRVALAALLVEAAHADGVYLGTEREMIDHVLAQHFGLSPQAAYALRKQGEAAQAKAVDLVRFTRVLKEAVPHEDRARLLEALWAVIYADDDNDHREAALVRKLAGLLYVSDRDSGLARQRVLRNR